MSGPEMNSPEMIAACPGCGHGKKIAMAVGQLLQCDVCHTVFHAPIADELGPEQNVASDSFVVQPAGTQAAPPNSDNRSQSPRAGTESPREESSRDSRAAAEQSRPTSTCSWHNHELAMSESNDSENSTQSVQEHNTASQSPGGRARSPEAANDLYVRRLNSAGGKAAPQNPSSRLSDSRQTNLPATSIKAFPFSWTAVAVFIIGVVSVAGVSVAFWVNRPPTPSADPRSTPPDSPSAERPSVHWTDASLYSRQNHPVKLEVKRVKYGALRAKDLSNQVVRTEDTNLLGIVIAVHNRGGRARTFQSWYRHAFKSKQGGMVAAKLTDDQDRQYALLKFDDVRRIEGQSCSDSIAPKETVQDTVVFMIPEEIERSRIRYFRLKLPGAAVGLARPFRFQIPRSMVDGFQEE